MLGSGGIGLGVHDRLLVGRSFYVLIKMLLSDFVLMGFFTACLNSLVLVLCSQHLISLVLVLEKSHVEVKSYLVIVDVTLYRTSVFLWFFPSTCLGLCVNWPACSCFRLWRVFCQTEVRVR